MSYENTDEFDGGDLGFEGRVVALVRGLNELMETDDFQIRYELHLVGQQVHNAQVTGGYLILKKDLVG